MLFGKKQRALEYERDKYKAEVERLMVELTNERTILRALTNPPEGCRVGNWCKGCKHASIHREYTIAGKHEKVTACLYGACNRLAPIDA